MNAMGPEPMLSTVSAPPSNIEAERALLGAIMMNNRAVDRVSDILRDDHFYDGVNGRIYSEILRIVDGGGQANPVTLRSMLAADEQVKAAGGARYLTALAGAVVNIVNVPDYARLIVDLAIRRRLIEFGTAVAALARESDHSSTATEMLDRADHELTDIATGGGAPVQDVSIEVATEIAMKDWEESDKLDQSAGVSTGMDAVDDVMGRMRAGDLVVIAGNTSMGKTALTTTIAFNAAKSRKRVAFFTLEMPVDQLAGRIMTGLTGIPGPRQRRWKLTASDWNTLVGARQELHGMPLMLRYTPGLTLQQLRAAARRQRRHKDGLDLIVVDYLQIMGRTRDARFENRTREISEMTMGLKNLAGEIGVPIILVSQLSRENAKRDNPRPILSDLRDSGSIEQDADTVAFCYRHEYHLERNRPERREGEADFKFSDRLAQYENQLEQSRGIAEVIVAKRRHGPIGTARIRFDAKRAWFEDLVDNPSPPPGHPAAEQLPIFGGG